MEQPTTSYELFLDITIQILVIVIPIILTWFLQTYVRGTKMEKDVAAIIRLANGAIDYIENLDKQGAFDNLDLPPDMNKGLYKLGEATKWMDAELKRNHIQMDTTDAEKWIRAEFQKRIGDVQMVSSMAKAARDAVIMVNQLRQSGLIDLPPDTERVAYLTSLAADWVIAQLAEQGANVSREEALTWVHAEWLNHAKDHVEPHLSVEERLATLSQQAINFLSELKTSGRLAITGEHIEKDLATAWLLTEAARQGLNVSTSQIAKMMNEVMAS